MDVIPFSRFVRRCRGPERLMVVVALALALGIATSPAWSATTNDAAGRPLRVVTSAVAPFVLPKADPPAGFSIDLWNEVARRMGVEYAWSVTPTQPELLRVTVVLMCSSASC